MIDLRDYDVNQVGTQTTERWAAAKQAMDKTPPMVTQPWAYQAEPFEETLEAYRVRVLMQGGHIGEHYAFRKIEMQAEQIAALTLQLEKTRIQELDKTPPIFYNREDNGLSMLGYPIPPDDHNCDAMGCPSVGPHILEATNWRKAFEIKQGEFSVALQSRRRLVALIHAYGEELFPYDRTTTNKRVNAKTEIVRRDALEQMLRKRATRLEGERDELQARWDKVRGNRKAWSPELIAEVDALEEKYTDQEVELVGIEYAAQQWGLFEEEASKWDGEKLKLEAAVAAERNRGETLRERHGGAIALLTEAVLQIEYLDYKFMSTGTSAAVIARIKAYLDATP